ncbi:MAG: hypothetical protein EHM70_03860 [Chloroflexota bacterium]|nr:MAG: hypothetical protein EHM70_03860 [Chloroflexota bacterium]
MKKNFVLRGLLLLISLSFFQIKPVNTNQTQPVLLPDQGCTVFYAASEDVALAGNNEDYLNPLTRAWFIPAGEGRYGRVYFGFDELFPQGGLNDQGLFFDGLALPYKALVSSAQKPAFPGGSIAMIDEIMSKSATVEEALALIDRYSRPGLETGQLFFGDRSGNSAIVDGDTILRKEGSYQLATNFRLIENPDPPYPCERFTTANQRLSEASSYTVGLFTEILDATHAEGAASTVYSQVYDLKKGLIYLYLFHDFQNGIVIDLATELAKGPHMVAVASLFPQDKDLDLWTFQKLAQWKVNYETRIDPQVKPNSLGGLSGDYRVSGDASAPPIKIYLEDDQLYYQKPNELPLELYPESPFTLFHPFYNNCELKLTFQRNLIGQVTGAQATMSYNDFGFEQTFSLEKPGALSNRLIIGLGVLTGVAILGVALAVIVRFRRADRLKQSTLL